MALYNVGPTSRLCVRLTASTPLSRRRLHAAAGMRARDGKRSPALASHEREPARPVHEQQRGGGGGADLDEERERERVQVAVGRPLDAHLLRA